MIRAVSVGVNPRVHPSIGADHKGKHVGLPLQDTVFYRETITENTHSHRHRLHHRPHRNDPQSVQYDSRLT